MPKYRKGSVWSARDAQYVFDGVEKLLGTYEVEQGDQPEIRFGKANADIVPDTITGEVTVWDNATNPPAATAEVITDVWYVWLSDQQISAGKEVILYRSESTAGNWHVFWAECEDEQPPDVGELGLATRPEPQTLTTTFLPIENLAVKFASGSGAVWDGASGFDVTTSGTWKFDLNFIVESTANNAVVLVRGNSPIGAGDAIQLDIKTAGEQASTSAAYVANITEAQLPASVEIQTATDAGTEAVNWLEFQIVLSRLGVAS